MIKIIEGYQGRLTLGGTPEQIYTFRTDLLRRLEPSWFPVWASYEQFYDHDYEYTHYKIKFECFNKYQLKEFIELAINLSLEYKLNIIKQTTCKKDLFISV